MSQCRRRVPAYVRFPVLISFDVGYDVNDPADLVLEASPSFEHDAAIFTTDGQ